VLTAIGADAADAAADISDADAEVTDWPMALQDA
jgi:hypothetical protein